MTISAAAIYARISDDREGEALGVARQLADCRALAAARGWPVAAEYVDNDISAFTGKQRPQYEAMLTAIQDGSAQVVVAYHADRLHRAPVELERFIGIVEQAGAQVATATAGDLDLATASGRMVARMLGAAARGESERMSERIQRKALSLAEAGKVSGGGTRPFGYEPDRLTVRREEAVLIREAADRVLAGDSLRGIAADWAARGVVTPTGGPWSQTALRRMLMTARIAGWREHRPVVRDNGKRRRTHSPGTLVAKAVWPGIIDLADHDRLLAVLDDPGRRTTTTNARSYLLSGFLTCGVCGKPMRARPRADHVRRYICAKGPGLDGCGLAILADETETLISTAALLWLESPEFGALLAEREAVVEDGAAQALREAEERLEQLGQDFAAGLVNRTAFLKANHDLGQRVEALRRRLAADTGRRAIASVSGQARDRWPDMSLDQRRAVIGELVTRITVGPGRRGYNRFDPGRIDVEWRV